MVTKRTLSAGIAIILVAAHAGFCAPWDISVPNPATAPNHFSTTQAIPYQGTGTDNAGLRIKVIHSEIVAASTNDSVRMDGSFGYVTIGGEWGFSGGCNLQIFELSGETEILRIAQLNTIDP